MTIYATVTALAVGQAMVVFTGNRLAAKTVAVLTCLVFAVLAIFRGLVGTDTWLYEYLIEFRIRKFRLDLEPGFLYLIDLAAAVTSDPQLILRLFAGVFYGLVVAFIVRADWRELVFVATYFAPQYFLMYSMNGIRVGLATVLFLICYQSLVRGQGALAMALGALSLSIHYSILLPGLLLLFARLPDSARAKSWLRLLVLGALSMGVLALQGLADDRLDSYSNGTVTGSLAGLSGVIKLAIVLYLTRLLPIARERRRTLIVVCGSIGFGSALLAQYSYAGLRAIDLVIWLTPLLHMGEVPKDTPIPRRYLVGLAVVGLVGAAGVLRNIEASTGVGNSPFVPYVTLWGTEW